MIYGAEDTRLEQTVALNFMPDALASEPESIARATVDVAASRLPGERQRAGRKNQNGTPLPARDFNPLLHHQRRVIR